MSEYKYIEIDSDKDNLPEENIAKVIQKISPNVNENEAYATSVATYTYAPANSHQNEH